MDQCWSEQMLFNTKYDFLSLPLRLPCEVPLGLAGTERSVALGDGSTCAQQPVCCSQNTSRPSQDLEVGKSLCPAPNTTISSMQGRAPSHPHPNQSSQITPRAIFTKHRGSPKLSISISLNLSSTLHFQISPLSDGQTELELPTSHLPDPQISTIFIA